MIRDLAAGTDQTVAEVMEYAVAKDGSAIAYSVSSKTPVNDGAFVRKIADGSTKTLLTGQGAYKGFAFDAKATQLAFVSDRDDYASKASRFKLYHASITSNAAVELNVPADTRAGPTAVSENGRLEFSKDGARLFFGTAPPPHADPDDAPEPVKVDIWHFKDPEIQPMQKVRADEERKQNFRAMITLADKKFTQLASPDMPDVLTHDSGAVALGVSNVPYKPLISWDGSYDDDYLVSLSDGSRKQILKKANFPATLSPGSNYVLFFDEHDDNWHAIRTNDGQNINLTAKLGVKFQSETDDHPAHPSPYGSAGWTDGDKSVLLYDRYDIWEVKPDGSGGRRVTDGRREQIIFRYQRTEQAPPGAEEEGGPGRRDTEDPAVSTSRPLILSAVNENTRASGLYRVTLNSAAPPAKLVMLDKSVGVPIKARDADVYVFTLSRFEEFPNLWVSSGAFTDMKQISDANPQQAQYNWGKSELIDYVNADGKTLKAILTKPEDFDPSKKYPLLVYIYEQLSNNLYRYAPPAPGGSSINVTRYVSNGYIVLQPDIVYDIGYPGAQCAEVCVAGDAESHFDGLHRSQARRHSGTQLGRVSDHLHDHPNEHLPCGRSWRVGRRHGRRVRRHPLGHGHVACVPVREFTEPHRRATLGESEAVSRELADLLDRQDQDAVSHDGERRGRCGAVAAGDSVLHRDAPAGQRSVHVHVQRREARPAAAREPEALDRAPGRGLRLLPEGCAEARLDGARCAVPGQGQTRRDAAVQEVNGRAIASVPVFRIGCVRIRAIRAELLRERRAVGCF